MRCVVSRGLAGMQFPIRGGTTRVPHLQLKSIASQIVIEVCVSYLLWFPICNSHCQPYMMTQNSSCVLYVLISCYTYVCMNVCLFPPSLQKPPEDVTTQLQKKTGSAKRCEKKLKNESSSVTAETLPGGLQVVDFAEIRATEFQFLLKEKEMGKRTFQKLSCHMRQRAMSHNVRQLQRR